MTKEKIVIISAGILFVSIIIVALVNYWVNSSESTNEKENTINENNNEQQTGSGPENASFYIGGEEIKLVDGKSEIEATPGSASKIKTEILDEPVMGDMDGDGVADAGVILVETGGGGSGTFYYVAVAIKGPDNTGYTGSNAILLGDRIKPQTKGIEDTIYTINYSDRNEGEDFSTNPSVAVSKNFTFDGVRLSERE